jgi:N utilization substance protein A
LTGWQLDVINEEAYSSSVKAGYNELLSLPGVTIAIADALHEKGYFTAVEVADASVDELSLVRGVGKAKAQPLIDAAKSYKPGSPDQSDTQTEIETGSEQAEEEPLSAEGRETVDDTDGDDPENNIEPVD